MVAERVGHVEDIRTLDRCHPTGPGRAAPRQVVGHDHDRIGGTRGGEGVDVIAGGPRRGPGHRVDGQVGTRTRRNQPGLQLAHERGELAAQRWRNGLEIDVHAVDVARLHLGRDLVDRALPVRGAVQHDRHPRLAGGVPAVHRDREHHLHATCVRGVDHAGHRSAVPAGPAGTGADDRPVLVEDGIVVGDRRQQLIAQLVQHVGIAQHPVRQEAEHFGGERVRQRPARTGREGRDPAAAHGADAAHLRQRLRRPTGLERQHVVGVQRVHLGHHRGTVQLGGQLWQARWIGGEHRLDGHGAQQQDEGEDRGGGSGHGNGLLRWSRRRSATGNHQHRTLPDATAHPGAQPWYERAASERAPARVKREICRRSSR